MSRVEDLPGVGPALATAIRRRFGDDAGFYDAAKRMDVQAISAIDGVSEHRAVDLIRAVQGSTDDRWIGTAATRKVHDDILTRLQRFAATRHGRNRLRLLGPLAAPDEARQRIGHILEQKERVRNLDRLAVRKALRRLESMREPTPVCDTTILVVAGDDDEHARLHSIGVGKWAVLGTRRDLAACEDHEVVLADEADDIPHGVPLGRATNLDEVLPGPTLAWARQNDDVLHALVELATAFGQVTVAGDVLAQEAPVAGGQATDITHHAQRVHAAAQRRLQDEAARLDLDGATWMQAASGGPLPEALKVLIRRIVADAHRDFAAATGRQGHILEAGLPIGLDEDEVARLEEDAEASCHVDLFRQRMAAAKLIAGHKEAIQAEVAAWLEADADLAMGCFALHHDLRQPVVGDTFDLKDSLHLGLTGQGAEPISYRLGGSDPVAVLTGANSGGKSTLLEHLAQLAIMARLGLPVSGSETVVPWMEEIHLVTARKGLDAGAFETFLRGFLPIAQGDRRRLVLADEVESVTELEAAGRILAFFLDRIASSDSLAVMVTHMAPQLLRHTTAKLRIDGIEAVGLDAEDRLVVRRCPKMGTFARSTPELIVERLARRSDGIEGGLYRDLLACLRDPETGK